MKLTEETEQGFIAFISGIITIGIISAFGYFFSPSCGPTKELSVPFMILFQKYITIATKRVAIEIYL